MTALIAIKGITIKTVTFLLTETLAWSQGHYSNDCDFCLLTETSAWSQGHYSHDCDLSVDRDISIYNHSCNLSVDRDISLVARALQS